MLGQRDALHHEEPLLLFLTCRTALGVTAPASASLQLGLGAGTWSLQESLKASEVTHITLC